jgi:6-methylsalicylate decarboxylase
MGIWLGVCVEEAVHALDILKVDGIAVFTSYHDLWLGDSAFDPVFQELDRRRAVVYVHPSTADCCTRTVPNISPATIEYGTDRTRAIANWVFGGSGNRFPNLSLIFSHAGGTMPFLIERFEQEARVPRHSANLPDGALPLLRRYFYDTAQSANPVALGALARVVPLSQILFGSDFPYRDSFRSVAGLAESGFASSPLQMICRDNALRLLPRHCHGKCAGLAEVMRPSKHT